jgi:hypothetical protein
MMLKDFFLKTMPPKSVFHGNSFDFEFSHEVNSLASASSTYHFHLSLTYTKKASQTESNNPYLLAIFS